MEKLEDLAVKRWQFLSLVCRYQNDHDGLHEALADDAGESVSDLSESVAEGTAKDRISHFTLRLLAVISQDYSFRSLFILYETLLFDYRLKSISNREIRLALKQVRRHLNEDDKRKNSILAWSIDQILSLKLLNENEVTSETFKVPFQLVAILVSRRQVNLKNGLAEIGQHNANKFLICIFQNLLETAVKSPNCQNLAELQNPSYGFEEDDQRIANLMQRLKCRLIGVQSNLESSQEISANDVDIESKHFPPCFQRVHSLLQKHHRLGHHARVAYTLFLKEIGLPFDESLKFWSGHYSKLTSANHKCSHSWQNDAKKFEYSIRHLYGNIGGCKDYSAHSCSSILNRSCAPHEELGCTFAVADIEDLVASGGYDKKVIQSVASFDDHRKTCALHLSLTAGPVSSNTCSSTFDLVTKPSQYFQFHRKYYSQQ